MALATICASHTPLMGEGVASDATKAAVKAAFARLADRVTEFGPDLIVQFSPDHFNGFFYGLMPAFCVGSAAQAIGDWNTQAGPLPVPEADAGDLTTYLLDAGIDVAFSYRMTVDHGFVQIWEEMFGKARPYPAPVIPIFINCAAPPIPSYKRARLLGEAVGQWAKASGKRVLLVASGGLSHDPPIPDLNTASPELRERLIVGSALTPEGVEARNRRVLAAGEAAARGQPPCLPLNETWDRNVIAALLSGDLDTFDSFNPVQVGDVAGRGGNEILAWVAAFAAQRQAGPFNGQLEFYEAIDGWIAGMAMVAAQETEPSRQAA